MALLNVENAPNCGLELNSLPRSRPQSLTLSAIRCSEYALSILRYIRVSDRHK